MGDIIPFNSSLPAYLSKVKLTNSALTANVGGGGFPVLSIKGKVFTIVRGDEKQVVKRPDDGTPAGAIDVVIISANPNLSKVYYNKSYEEGSQDKPDCYSNDGISPAADAASPQSKTCAACKHNVWGTGQNGKGRKCGDHRRLAVAPAGLLNDPMLLRIPPATLKVLAEYGDMLGKRGVPFPAVVTRISFDPGESSPKLQFSPQGLLPEAQFAAVAAEQDSDIVQQIIGVSESSEVAAPAPKPSAVSKQELVQALEEDEDEDEDEDDGEEEEEVVVAPPPKAEKKAKNAHSNASPSELDALLAALDG